MLANKNYQIKRSNPKVLGIEIHVIEVKTDTYYILISGDRDGYSISLAPLDRSWDFSADEDVTLHKSIDKLSDNDIVKVVDETIKSWKKFEKSME